MKRSSAHTSENVTEDTCNLGTGKPNINKMDHRIVTDLTEEIKTVNLGHLWADAKI